MKEKIINLFKWSVGICIAAGVATFLISSTKPEIIETEIYGVLCTYKDKPTVMIDGDYCRITDADLYLYAIENQNTKIKLNVDIEKKEKFLMSVNGWYDTENNYHDLEREEE